MPAPPECGQATLWATKYENIFLTQDTGDWEEMGDDLDISKYIKERDDFIMWGFEERLGHKETNFSRRCANKSFINPQMTSSTSNATAM